MYIWLSFPLNVNPGTIEREFETWSKREKAVYRKKHCQPEWARRAEWEKSCLVPAAGSSSNVSSLMYVWKIALTLHLKTMLLTPTIQKLLVGAFQTHLFSGHMV